MRSLGPNKRNEQTMRSRPTLDEFSPQQLPSDNSRPGRSGSRIARIRQLGLPPARGAVKTIVRG
jgi:hypothetical protein